MTRFAGTDSNSAAFVECAAPVEASLGCKAPHFATTLLSISTAGLASKEKFFSIPLLGPLSVDPFRLEGDDYLRQITA